MTAHMDHAAMPSAFQARPIPAPLGPPAAAVAPEWDLDVSIVESGPVVEELMRLTDDGCGSTCESACSTTCP